MSRMQQAQVGASQTTETAQQQISDLSSPSLDVGSAHAALGAPEANFDHLLDAPPLELASSAIARDVDVNAIAFSGAFAPYSAAFSQLLAQIGEQKLAA